MGEEAGKPVSGGGTVGETLSRPDMHQAWIDTLRVGEVIESSHRILADLVARTDLEAGAKVLDAGCGTGTNSNWLAAQGFEVTGADFSEFALAQARARDRVIYQREDLTALTFADGSFDAVFCIGVLMHVPAVERALDELVRVVKPGGWLGIVDANAHAPEIYAFRLYWRLRGRAHRVETNARGVEVWNESPAGPMLSRKFSFGWLTRFLEARGMRRTARTSAELTELYIYGLKPAHRLNRWWSRLRGPAALAVGNAVLFRKG